MNAKATNTRFCKYCGASAGMNASFCIKCGQNISLKKHTGSQKVDSERAAQIVEQNRNPTASPAVMAPMDMQQMIGAGAQAAALAQSLQQAQWKVVVGDELPQNPFPELVKAAGFFSTKLSGFLRYPALALFIATLMKKFTAAINTFRRARK